MSQSELLGERRVRVGKTSATLVHIILVSQFSILENEADKINKAKVGFSKKKMGCWKPESRTLELEPSGKHTQVLKNLFFRAS